MLTSFLEKHKIMAQRTDFCKHDFHSCLLNALKGFSSNFYYGFLAKAFIALIFGLINPRKNMIPNLLGLLSKDTLGFCAFLGSVAGSYKLVL